MKLNKPKVSDEDRILSDYVDFLLTDHSNVHPLHQDNTPAENARENEHNADSPTVISAQKEAPVIGDNQDKSVASPATGQPTNEDAYSEAAAEVAIKANLVSDETALNETQKPNWSTIENARIKREAKSESLLRETDKTASVPSESAKSESGTIESGTTESGTTETLDSLNAKLPHTQSLVNNEEPPEEEQLKAWDELITREKEAEILQQSDGQSGAAHEHRLTPADGRVLTAESESESLDSSEPDMQLDVEKALAEYSQSQADPRLQKVEQLLAKISLATMPKVTAEAASEKKTEKQVASAAVNETEINEKAAAATFYKREPQPCRKILPEVFQTLIFEVGKLPLAVPLLKLGGIIKIASEDITSMVGTPDWFMGLVSNERGSLMVVDTQKYLMPEQSPAAEFGDYQYLILLDDSNWALACHTVEDAKNLMQSDIRWSEKTSRRPWFAGMVIDYMSALIEVDELINMLAANISD